MVLRIESGDNATPPMAVSTPTPPASSIENGTTGGSVPVRAGRPVRRRCQFEFEQPRLQQQSESFNTNDVRYKLPQSMTTDTSLLEAITFRRWRSLMSSGNCDLPKSIQSSPTYLSSSSSCSNIYHPLALLAIILIGSVSICLHQHSQLINLRSEIQITNQHRQYMGKARSNLLTQLASREESLDQYRDTQKQIRKVNNDLATSVRNLREDYDASSKELERFKDMERRAELSEGRWDRYVERTKDFSKRSVVEKFGKGPHHVQLQVQLSTSPSLETIKIELAPLDMMPHSVHTFLEQIDLGAWDGAAFDIHAGHVLMAHSSLEATTIDDQFSPPQVKFPEYNAKYPHEKYTIAFPGQPSSSPGVYINLQPNNIHHSPRIEAEEYVEGEPCFGTIFDENSRRIVDRMDGLRVGDRGLLQENVVIVSTRITGR